MLFLHHCSLPPPWNSSMTLEGGWWTRVDNATTGSRTTSTATANNSSEASVPHSSSSSSSSRPSVAGEVPEALQTSVAMSVLGPWGTCPEETSQGSRREMVVPQLGRLGRTKQQILGRILGQGPSHQERKADQQLEVGVALDQDQTRQHRIATDHSKFNVRFVLYPWMSQTCQVSLFLQDNSAFWWEKIPKIWDVSHSFKKKEIKHEKYLFP